jgi:hypothetical protein
MSKDEFDGASIAGEWVRTSWEDCDSPLAPLDAFVSDGFEHNNVQHRVVCPVCTAEGTVDDGFGTHLSRVDVASDGQDYVFDKAGRGDPHPESFKSHGNVRGTIAMLVFTFEHCSHQACIRFQFHKGSVFVTVDGRPANASGWENDVWRT